MEWMILPFRRYVDFTGRSRRMEFWMFQLLNLVVYALLLAVMFSGLPWQAMMDQSNMGAPPPGVDPDNPFSVFGMFGVTFWAGGALVMLWWLGTIIPMLAVTVRRLHDRGMSGWWYGGLLIASFIPLVSIIAFPGYIALLVVALLPSQPGMNKWGDNPKNPVQASIFE